MERTLQQDICHHPIASHQSEPIQSLSGLSEQYVYWSIN